MKPGSEMEYKQGQTTLVVGENDCRTVYLPCAEVSAFWVVFFMLFCRLLIFFNINFFKKFFREYHQSVRQFGSRSDTTFLSGQIRVKIVCKGYQQTTSYLTFLKTPLSFLISVFLTIY